MSIVAPSFLPMLPRGLWEKTQPSGDSKGRLRRLTEAPKPTRLCPSLTLAFLPTGWAVSSRPQEQVQGPPPGLSGHHSLGFGQRPPKRQAPAEGPRRTVWEGVRLPCLGAPVQPRKDAGGERGGQGGGWGLGGGDGAAGKALPRHVALQSLLPQEQGPRRRQERAQACASRARTCTLGRQNQDGGSSLLLLSSWKRMWRKKSPV